MGLKVYVPEYSVNELETGKAPSLTNNLRCDE
jgi:hypothetical protein